MPMAWPLGLGALVELGVGAGMAFGAHMELARHTKMNAEAIAALIPKLAGQIQSYRVATRVELGLIMLAALLSLSMPRTSTVRAVSLGILVEAIALLCFDTIGFNRATWHLTQLRASGPTAAVSHHGSLN